MKNRCSLSHISFSAPMSSDTLEVHFPEWGTVTLADEFARCYLGDLAGLAVLPDLKHSMPVRRDGRIALLHIAAYMGHDHVVEWLLSRASNREDVELHFSIHSPDIRGRTPLLVAIERGHTRCAERILIYVWENFRRDPWFYLGSSDRDGCGLLHYACRYGRVDFLRTIRRLAPDTCLQYWFNRDGRAPLDEACFYGQADCVREMMGWLNGLPESQEYRRRCRRRGSQDPGISAMLIAARQGHVEALAVMTEWIHYGCESGRHGSLWKEAVVHGHVHVLEFLRSLGAKTFDYHSLLHLACASGHAQVLRWLLRQALDDVISAEDVGFYGASLEKMLARKSSVSGNTPLHVACACRHVECVNVILEAWPDILEHVGKNAYELTPFDLAAGCPEIRNRVISVKKRVELWVLASRKIPRQRRLCR